MNLRAKYTIILLPLLLGSIAFLPLIYAAPTNEPRAQEVSAQVKDSAKKESLTLILLGTVMESESAKSIAVIKDMSSQKQGVYKVGDKILGYQIVKILRGRIVLLKDGRISLLDFPLGSQLMLVTVVSPNKRIVNRSVLAKKIPNLNVAIGKAEVFPHIESGKVIGFKLTKIKDRELAKMAGLKEGDVITQVNGQRLNTLQKPLEIYQNIRNQDKIDLEIRRDNKIKSLTYYMN